MLKNVKNKIIPFLLVIIISLSISIIPASAKSDKVIIGGEAFGIKLYCKGVMITHFQSFASNGKKICPAKTSGLKTNDIILKADSKIIKSNEQLEEYVKKSKGKIINFNILRNNKKLIIKTKPQLNPENEYYIGVWVRDSCAGIGTISYYSEDKKEYGALGHGICDVDTGGLFQSGKGEILQAKISSITKSKNNKIGTLNGYFTNSTIGNIKENTINGVHGALYKKTNKNNIYKTGKISDVKIGDAQVISTIKGTSPKYYKIKIINICNNNKNSGKNFVIKVTDKKLLRKTGGIVQGMSGSPIIQDNKFVGVLTHVFLEDCKKGYGMYAENIVK